MAILKVANVHHDASGYTRTQTSTANTISWVTSNEVKATLNATGVLHVHQGINTSNLLVNGVPATDAANSYAYSTGLAAGAGANTVGSAAFAKANNALANTTGITFNGSLTFSHNMRVTGNAFFDGPGSTKIRSPSANDMAFSTTETERMRITNTGNVGIGTSNPRQVLDVQGKINASGFMVNSLPAYALANIRYFTGTTANTSYVPPVGVKAILVELIGGGGGGGSANGIGAGSVAGGRAGGGGGYTALLISNTNQTFTYTIGAGGAGGPGGATGEVSGTNGGDTYFYGGSLGTTILLAIAGGDGGVYMPASTSDLYTDDGGNGGYSMGYDGSIIIRGQDGGGGMRGSVMGYGLGGRGGRSFLCNNLSGAQTNSGSQTGTAAEGPGCGGGGAAVADSTANPSGGDGADGIVKITEYY